MRSGARLAFVVTHPVTAKLLLGRQLEFLKERGYRVTVVSSPGPVLDEVRERHGVDVVAVAMTRGLHLREGPRSFAAMVRALRRIDPDILNASTPKAALLALTTGRLLRVPHRVYLVRGSFLEVTRGAANAAYLAAEHVMMNSAREVVFVGESLRELYVARGFRRAESAHVIPSNGIDTTRFRPRADMHAARAATRERLGIGPDAIVVGFVGRLVADKGVADLVRAVERLRTRMPGLRLLLVGGDIAGDQLPASTAEALQRADYVVQTGVVADPAPFYAAMDLLAFPSYREGLPNVALEAAACELPVVGYRVTGVRDAIVDGVTGALVDAQAVDALAAAIARYSDSSSMRALHGEAGRRRVIESFEQRSVWRRWVELYDSFD